jgi:hypothetical protein
LTNIKLDDFSHAMLWVNDPIIDVEFHFSLPIAALVAASAVRLARSGDVHRPLYS